MGLRNEPVGGDSAGKTRPRREVPQGRRPRRRSGPRRTCAARGGITPSALPTDGLDVREGPAQEQGARWGIGRVRHSPRHVSGGAPGHHPRATTATTVLTSAHHEADTPHGTAALDVGSTVVVTAEAYPPVGRRSQWLLLVKSCVFCGYAHGHRGSPAGGPREAGCGRGEYMLRPVVAGRWAA